MVGVDLQKVRDVYEALAQKYDLTLVEVEMYFLETLIEFFKTSDLYLTGSGLMVEGKYRNVKKEDFKRIKDNFMFKCNAVSKKKSVQLLKTTLASNNRVMYGKIIEDRGYSYLIQPMKSKTEEYSAICAVDIPKKGFTVPEFITILPIWVNIRTIRVDENKIKFMAKLFTHETLSLHLERVLENMRKNGVVLDIKVQFVKDDLLILINKSSIEPTKKMINQVLNYFRQFGFVCHLIRRKGDKR